MAYDRLAMVWYGGVNVVKEGSWRWLFTLMLVCPSSWLPLLSNVTLCVHHVSTRTDRRITDILT
jgi:hypothetical protein